MQTLAPTWNLTQPITAKWYGRALPCLTDFAFLLPFVLLFWRANGTKTLFADGDTGWHIRTGEWIIQHGAVPKHDLFSFTKPGEVWFAWEWGWDVVMAFVHSLAGLAGVGFLNVLLLGVISVLLYRHVRHIAQNDAISFFVTALVLCISSIHWLARPHLVSWLFVIIFLSALQSAGEGRVKALFCLPVAMVFWTNLHAGFVAGIVILLCHAAGTAASSLLRTNWRWADAWHKSRAYWTAAGLCVLATFVNPYGWHLHLHVIRYLADKDLLDRIQEFQSLSFHAGPAMLFEAMLLLGAFALLRCLQKGDIATSLAIVLWARWALLSARHIPLFLLICAAPVACLLNDFVAELRRLPSLASLASTVTDICDELRAMERPRRWHLVSAAGLLVFSALCALGKGNFDPQFNPEMFPVRTIALIQSYSAKRIFTSDQWGDYLIYRLYPAQRVFFDGRSDFYGNEFVKVNQRLLAAEYDWKQVLRQFGIDMVILKPDVPLSAVLKITPECKVLFDDGKAIVFLTKGIYHTKSGTQKVAFKRLPDFVNERGTRELSVEHKTRFYHFTT